MLPNSDSFVCSPDASSLRPVTEPLLLSSAPYDLARQSANSFLVCDSVEELNQTLVRCVSMPASEPSSELPALAATTLVTLPSTYERWDCLNDCLLLVNREGDLTHVNLNNKCVDTIKRQHPGFNVEVVHTDSDFVTSGGHVKALSGSGSERIVKIWGVDADDKLYCKGRFGTGHVKPIEKTILMNRTSLVTMSKDRRIHVADLIQEATIAVIPTGSEEPLSGCQIDYNSLLYGGNRPSLSVVDIRTRKCVRDQIDLKEELVQLTNMVRFSDSEVMLCNVNQLQLLDLRRLEVRLRQKVDGETNWGFKVLGAGQFAIGNREKFVQVWEAV